MFIDPNTLFLRLEAIETVSPRIKIFRFISPEGRILPAVTPGAHLDIEISPGLIRQYSLVEIDPASTQYAIAVLRQPEGRGGSMALHDNARIGAIYKASMPRNHFPLNSEAGETVLFGGGIGVTPLLTMYRALKACGERVRLFYWTRSSDDFLFKQELMEDPAVQLFATETSSSPRLADLLPDISPSAQLYCCGPDSMLNAFTDATKDRPQELLNIERFAAATSGANNADATFTVMLQRQGKTFEIPTDKTILQVCLDEGIDIPYSCEEGVCGACQVRVLEGEVEHRDSVWPASTHERDGTMIICCSRAVRGPLVLDI